MADEQTSNSAPRPRITIEFEGPDSASARLHIGGITRGQRLVAVGLLAQWDHDMHDAEVAALMQQVAEGNAVARKLKLVQH